MAARLGLHSLHSLTCPRKTALRSYTPPAWLLPAPPPRPPILTNHCPLPEFDFSQTSVPFVPGVRRILVFRASTIAAFRVRLQEQQQKTTPGQETGKADEAAIGCQLSATDSLCGMLWAAIAQARRLRSVDTSRFFTAVDIRQRLQGALDLHPDFGNAILPVVAEAPVASLDWYSRDGRRERLEAKAARLAWRLRAAINGTSADGDAWARRRIELLRALPSPTDAFPAAFRAADSGHSGLHMTSSVNFGDIEWEIPGVHDDGAGERRRCASARRSALPLTEGALNILPRVGGTKGDADWEVLVHLSRQDMERLCADDGLGPYLHRVLE